MSCQIQIYYPRNQITNCVGNIYIDEKIEKIVNTIMNTRGNQTNYGKSHKLPKLWGDIQSLELACLNCSHILQCVRHKSCSKDTTFLVGQAKLFKQHRAHLRQACPFFFVLVHWNLRILHGQRQALLRKVGHIESDGLDAFVKIKENPKDMSSIPHCCVSV